MTPPEIVVARIRHGTFAGASRLNPRFIPGRPLLLATLDIRWNPPAPAEAIAALEAELLAFSPGLRGHQCRGSAAYRVVSGGRGTNGKDHDPPRSRTRTGADPFDPRLAFAHLLEHVVIDLQCEVTGERLCSGITGEHRATPGRFDLIVECGAERVGRCCLILALGWLTGLVVGHLPGAEARELMAALKWIHRRGNHPIRSPALAGALGFRPERAERALAALTAAGYLREAIYTVNLSGLSEYRMADDDGEESEGELRA
jgi:hypothetical protein